MNIISPILAEIQHEKAPPMLIIIFWILIILWFIGGLELVSPTSPNYIGMVRGRNIVVAVLLAILGYYTFGF